MSPSSYIPRATYRLQLNRDFTFAKAEAIVPYLSTLGISHCYVSPCFKSSPRQYARMTSWTTTR